MAKTEPGTAKIDASAGHLSVHIPGAHPDEVPFLFGQQPQRLGYSFVASLGVQAAFVALLILLTRLAPPISEGLSLVFEPPSEQIVWLSEPGPGGGGGGGGNQMPEPPRKMELPGKEKISVPVQKPVVVTPKPEPKEEPKPIDEITIPALTQASAAEALKGIVATPLEAPPSLSQGSGTGGGAGTGAGTGSGPGSGSGLGPGSGGGTGGGTYKPGNGVTTPIAVDQVKPQYTSEAMRARIQGTVWVECIVQPNGVCTDVHVVRSLDPNFGLDQEAVKAARLWRFKPGTRLGQPVPVLVTIELSFALR
jgi:periplasmic protein TonB